MFIQVEKFRQLFKELSRRNVNEVRMYDCGENAYPSVTSIISFVSREKFASWRARVGNEEANKITKHSTTRGTDLHYLFEMYLQNKNVKEYKQYQKPLIQYMFNFAKPYIDEKLNNIYQQETTMYSDRLCLAGTVDLICEVNGELAIVDFKTSKKEKPEEWLEDYFVQLSAYWAMFSEKTGVAPKKLVVFLVGENGDVQIVERRNPIDYLKTLRNYVDQFVRYHA
jgi:genome maintenance exonuclease 1